MAETNDHSINHLMSASAPYEQVGVSPLVQRSLDRLTTSVGIINTRQMHRHQTTTNALADRLLQRLSLPEQQASRYQIGVLQSEAIAPSIQRFQRREAMPDSSAAEVWRADRPSLFDSGDASSEISSPVISRVLPVEPALPAIARSVEPAPRLDRAEVAPAADSGGVFRIRRRAQSVEPVVSNSFPLATPGQRDIKSSAEPPGGDFTPALTNTAPVSPPRSERSDSGSLASIPSSPATVQRRYTLAEVVQRSALSSQARSPQVKSAPTSLVYSQAMQPSEATPANPTIQRRYSLAEVAQPSRSESDGEPTAIALVQVNPGAATLQRQADPPSTVSRMTDAMPRRYALADVVQRSVLPSQESSQTTTTPLLSGQTNPLPVIQRRSLSNSNEATTLPLVQPPVTDSPLPLAITAQVNPSSLNRQETSPTVVAPAETINATSQATASTAQPSPAQTMNAADMVDQVSRILSRQLAVERERRGMGL